MNEVILVDFGLVVQLISTLGFIYLNTNIIRSVKKRLKLYLEVLSDKES